MGRTLLDAHKDMTVLKKLALGDRVRYVGDKEKNKGKTGIVSKFNDYGDGYDYTSVTVKLDGTNKHINVSPRNLKKI